MSEEAAKQKARKDEAKAECDEVLRLLNDGKDSLSGDENELDRTRIAKGLATRLAMMAKAMQQVEADLPPLRFMRLLDALANVFMKVPRRASGSIRC